METQLQDGKLKSLEKGYIQVYTGNGKGNSEIEALERFSDVITIRQYGRGCFIGRNPQQEDIKAAHTGLEEVKMIMQYEDYDMVILDEANVAVQCNLISIDELLQLVNSKPFGMELIITGRYAQKEILEVADLVTEMREIKHYYQKGIQARIGIEK
jgi:cob(I)alamin adenosyltransferase